MAYELKNLSPSDFEDLVRDLLQAERGVYVESFTTGRDRGIDLRYSSIRGQSTIVQCKHFIASGWSKLRSNLVKELEKVKQLSPNHYILVTSVGLTPQNKDDIVSVMSPYIVSTADIFGNDDIQNLLLRHGRVAQNHFKLWLASTDVLERLISNATFVRTDAIRSQLIRQVKLFVSNDSFRRALDILSSQHVCIIAGLPGIGKTMLARMLMLHHIEQGYEALSVSSDIDEANQLYREETHQFFYYDDFLGTSFHEGLQKNEDSRLLEFMSLISRVPNKRLVLTTREYILRHAYGRYEQLSHFLRESLKCVIDLKDYTKLIRGRILYNHIYFSDLKPEQKLVLCRDQRYLAVIGHANFSPRLIEYAIDKVTQDDIDPLKIPVFFGSILDNPQRLWEHAFNNQLTADAQAILLALVFFPENAVLQDVGSLARSISLSRSGRDIPPATLYNELKTIDGTFVSLDGSNPAWPRVRFHNPAIRDYLLHHVDGHPSELTNIVDHSPFFEPLVNICHAATSANLQGSDRAHHTYLNLLPWLVENARPFRDALQRALNAESCVWNQRYLPHLQLVLERTTPTTESRLFDIVDISTTLKDDTMRNWVQTKIKDVSAKWSSKQGDRENAAKLLSITPLNEGVIATVKGWLLEDLSEADDFDAAICLLEYSPNLSDPDFIASLEDRYYQYVASTNDYILYDADDTFLIRRAIEDVDTLSHRLGLEPDWDKYKIDERIAALTEEEDDFELSKALDAHKSSPPQTGPLAITEDRQVELLFDSLLRDEEG